MHTTFCGIPNPKTLKGILKKFSRVNSSNKSKTWKVLKTACRGNYLEFHIRCFGCVDQRKTQHRNRLCFVLMEVLQATYLLMFYLQMAMVHLPLDMVLLCWITPCF